MPTAVPGGGAAKRGTSLDGKGLLELFSGGTVFLDEVRSAGSAPRKISMAPPASAACTSPRTSPAQ